MLKRPEQFRHLPELFNRNNQMNYNNMKTDQNRSKII